MASEEHNSHNFSNNIVASVNTQNEMVTELLNEQSMIQNWEREQDVHLGQPHIDLTDPWSSDGDSISSSSTGISDSPDVCGNASQFALLSSDGDECNSNTTTSKNVSVLPTLPSRRNGVNALRHAGVFSSEEVVDQAIDRWQSYWNLCLRAIHVLRQQLVDAYIPYALEQHKTSLNRTTSIQTSNLSIRAQMRQRALKNMLHHSAKTANQQHLMCVSKFAVVSNRLAKWRKSLASQQCRFKDPTTTTWEKHCTNLCLPLLPVCLYHLVQLKPAPEIYECELNDLSRVKHEEECYNRTAVVEANPQYVSPLTSTTHNLSSCSDTSLKPKPAQSNIDFSKTLLKLTRSGKGYVDQSMGVGTSTGNMPTLQLPTQYLFRRCTGGPNHNCPEPVISWHNSVRCIYHTTSSDLCQEPDGSSQPNTFSQSINHLLCSSTSASSKMHF